MTASQILDSAETFIKSLSSVINVTVTASAYIPGYKSKSVETNLVITVLAAAAVVYPISVATYAFGTNRVSLVFGSDSIKYTKN